MGQPNPRNPVGRRQGARNINRVARFSKTLDKLRLKTRKSGQLPQRVLAKEVVKARRVLEFVVDFARYALLDVEAVRGVQQLLPAPRSAHRYGLLAQNGSRGEVVLATSVPLAKHGLVKAHAVNGRERPLCGVLSRVRAPGHCKGTYQELELHDFVKIA